MAQQPHLGSGPRHYWGLMITLRHTTLSWTPLEEGSVRRRDLYLTTHNTHKRQISMTPAGFEPTIPARERQQTCALSRAVTGISPFAVYSPYSFLPTSIQYFIINLLTAYFFIFFAIISLHFHHTFFLVLYHNYFLLRLLTSFCPPSGTLHWRYSRTRIFASWILRCDILYSTSMTIHTARNFGARVAQSVKELTQDRVLGVIFSINETPVFRLHSVRTGSGYNRPPIRWTARGLSWWRVKLTTDLYLVSCLDRTGHGTVQTCDQIRLICYFNGGEEAS
jgi:hypothetical protein